MCLKLSFFNRMVGIILFDGFGYKIMRVGVLR